MKLKIDVVGNLLIGGYSNSLTHNMKSAEWEIKSAKGKKEEKYFYIPGPTLRGAIRERAEQIANSKERYKEAFKSLFGDKDKEGKIAIGSAFLDIDDEDSKEKAKFPMERTRTAMSRSSKNTVRKSLFSYISSGRNFTLYSNLIIYSDLTDDEYTLLKASIKLVDSLGSNKSLGMGRVNISLIDEDVLNNSDENKFSVNKNGEYLMIVTLLEPLRITQNKSKDYFYDTYKYIPGTTLRGAFAKFLDDNQLDRIIKSGKVNFPNLYPSEKKENIFPTPITTRAIKGNDKIYTDLLLPYILKYFLEKEGYVFSIEERSINDERLAKLEGYCRLNSIYLEKANYEMKVFYNTNISISRGSRSTKKGMLWTYMSVMNKHFVGKFYCEDENIVKELSKIKFLKIGGGKNRGYGLAKIDIINSNFISLEKLIHGFNKEIKSILSPYLRNFDDNEVLVPILLASDCILPYEKTFKEILNDYDLEVLFNFVRSSITSGFSDLYKREKDIISVIEKGGIILAKTQRKEKYDNLQKLVRNGIGLKRQEGYGRIEIISTLIKNDVKLFNTTENSRKKKKLSKNNNQLRQIINKLNKKRSKRRKK